MILERLPEPLEMRDLALEHRHLDAVVAGRLELGQERQVLVGDVGRPEQKIEPGFHVAPRPRPTARRQQAVSAIGRRLTSRPGALGNRHLGTQSPPRR